MPPLLPLHDHVVKLAAREIGVHEIPYGSNTGKRVREYQAATWLGGTGWPWCVAFCVWAWQQAGRVLPYRGAGAYQYAAWARKNGWAVPAANAIPGDMVVFSIGAGHMALLEEIVGQNVHTIDGNSLNQVRRVSRPLSHVHTFIHIPEAPHLVTPPKPPVFEVVTSEQGGKVIYVSGARAVGRMLPEILRRHARVVVRRRR